MWVMPSRSSPLSCKVHLRTCVDHGRETVTSLHHHRCRGCATLRPSRFLSRSNAAMSGLIVPHRGFVPKVARSAFIAPNATLVGDVEIGENASIWFGVILRGDGPGIRIGENSNLQDGTVVHIAARGLMTVVGRNVSVGHMALLHACEV